VIFTKPPVAIMKSMKNPTEAQGMKNAHVRDAAALIISLAKIEASVSIGTMNYLIYLFIYLFFFCVIVEKLM
jgi:Xaa-Pro aminopeptidase